MSIAALFEKFLGNLAITNGDTISLRYGELTAAINKKFRNTESKTDNTFQVGSFGRRTGIDGLSDLDMLYIMPKGKWDTYKDGKQRKLLQDVKEAILARYPKTDVNVDRLVVTATYKSDGFHVEVQPVFEQDDGSYKYPETTGEGSWKITKPREEMKAIAEMDEAKNSNLRSLCKMSRAWRNKHGLEMGGLLIDTLAYNFLESTTEYDSKSYFYYDWLSRDFFGYLSALEDQDYYAALGSRQRVKVKKKFQRKAKKAHKLSLEAIAAEKTSQVNSKWRKIYGRPCPATDTVVKEDAATMTKSSWRNTEEFIEDRHPVDIRYTLKIDCQVKQNGFREHFLRELLSRTLPLLANKKLEFEITEINVPEPYSIEWKVLNRGEVAKRRNCVRGQIVYDDGNQRKRESTNFKGDHIVECYAVKDGVVVAKDRIRVPIATNEYEID